MVMEHVFLVHSSSGTQRAEIVLLDLADVDNSMDSVEGISSFDANEPERTYGPR